MLYAFASDVTVHVPLKIYNNTVKFDRLSNQMFGGAVTITKEDCNIVIEVRMLLHYPFYANLVCVSTCAVIIITLSDNKGL